MGSSRALAPDVVGRLYPSQEAYAAQWCAAVDDLVTSGVLRAEDAEEMQDRVPPLPSALNMPVRFGYVTPNSWGLDTPQQVVDLAVQAEALGADSLWVSHHVLHRGFVAERLVGQRLTTTRS